MNVNNWYVILTSVRAEFKAFERLERLGFKVFLPTTITVRVWSDRKKKLILHQIPSMVFIQCSCSELKNVYNVYRVRNVLSFFWEPAQVQDWEIENLRIVAKELNGSFKKECNCSFQIGEAVKVIRGPFKVLFGVSVQVEGKHRVVIKIDLIRAAFTAIVPKYFVVKV
jgi:transcription antitermination factor NusG